MTMPTITRTLHRIEYGTDSDQIAVTTKTVVSGIATPIMEHKTVSLADVVAAAVAAKRDADTWTDADVETALDAQAEA